jgi:DHA3 family macrolide efflux protein-like MFS transporter
VPGPAQSGPSFGSVIAHAFGRFFRELAEVGRVVARNRLVAFVLASIVVSTFISAVSYTVLIFLVQQRLGLGTGGVGIFAGVLAVGMIAGATSMGFMPRNINRTHVVVGVITLYGLLFLAGPWLITVWYMVIVALIAGVAFSWLGIVQTTMLQEQVPPEIRGRIFSTREFITNAVFIATTMVTGVFCDLTSIKAALLAIGATLVVMGTAGFFWTRRLGAGKG